MYSFIDNWRQNQCKMLPRINQGSFCLITHYLSSIVDKKDWFSVYKYLHLIDNYSKTTSTAMFISISSLVSKTKVRT